MTFEELDALRNEMDKDLGPAHSRWTAEAITMRLTLESAISLKWIEERGVGLYGIGTRGESLCVSLEIDATK